MTAAWRSAPRDGEDRHLEVGDLRELRHERPGGAIERACEVVAVHKHCHLLRVCRTRTGARCRQPDLALALAVLAVDGAGARPRATGLGLWAEDRRSLNRVLILVIVIVRARAHIDQASVTLLLDGRAVQRPASRVQHTCDPVRRQV